MDAIGPGWAREAWVGGSWIYAAWGARTPAGRRRYILPDGRRVYTTRREAERLLDEWRQEQPEPKKEVKPKEAKRRAKKAPELVRFDSLNVARLMVPPEPVRKKKQAIHVEWDDEADVMDAMSVLTDLDLI